MYLIVIGWVKLDGGQGIHGLAQTAGHHVLHLLGRELPAGFRIHKDLLGTDKA